MRTKKISSVLIFIYTDNIFLYMLLVLQKSNVKATQRKRWIGLEFWGSTVLRPCYFSCNSFVPEKEFHLYEKKVKFLLKQTFFNRQEPKAYLQIILIIYCLCPGVKSQNVTILKPDNCGWIYPRTPFAGISQVKEEITVIFH